MSECFFAEGRVWARVLKSLAAQLARIVLVNGHEGVSELTVFQHAIHVFVESQEEQVTVLLGDGDVQVSQGHV